ncbi:MAG: hypothetical protein HYS51_01260 [Candidatus Zambryskibacteria bacterium]|nr:hypothetical protein [Candidatus Zambryskibacteria bacterium]
MEQETFWTLVRDVAHWEFEIFLIIIFDVIIGILIWPRIRKLFKHHEEDDHKLAELEERVNKLERGK